jgi:hypothetical protein
MELRLWRDIGILVHGFETSSNERLERIVAAKT